MKPLILEIREMEMAEGGYVPVPGSSLLIHTEEARVSAPGCEDRVGVYGKLIGGTEAGKLMFTEKGDRR